MISKIATRRPVATIMVTFMALLAGILSYTNLNLSLMPNVDVPVALVSTTYIGAGPEEISNLVSQPLEDALGSVTNVEVISSISSSNSSMVIMQFVDGTDLDMATVDVREVLDRVKENLPEDAGSPTILKIDMNATPIAVGVTSKVLNLNQLNSLVKDDIAPRLERIEGVASVDISGGIETEIRLTVNPDRLSLYGLTPSTLSQMLQAENMNLPSGSLDQGTTSVNIRVLGQFENLEQIKKLPLSTPSGAKIQLEDVALVEEVETNRDNSTYINGTGSILLNVNKQSTANLVKVSESLQKELDKLSQEYGDCSILMLSDSSGYIQDSITNVTYTALLSAVIAFFVLLVFLKNPVTSAIIATSIPTSIFIAFALMYLSDMSLNTISMGGIAIGIGMLVDNSIVVLDSIYSYYERGYSPRDASEYGAKEVTMSITASTLTTVAVFLPMAFISGTVGDMMSNLSLSVTYSLVASLAVSITFIPMACSLLLQRSRLKMPRKNIFTLLGWIWDLLLNTITKIYELTLRLALHTKILTFALIIYVFYQTLLIVPLMSSDFMDATDEGVANINITMPSGTKFDFTEELTLEALYRLEVIPEVELVYANISTSSSTITMNLCSKEERDRSTTAIAREAEVILSGLAGAKITASASSDAMGDMGSGGVSFNVYGYDNSTLIEVEKDLIALLESNDAFINPSGSTGETIPEARVVINRSAASSHGITTATIASALNTATSGSTATQYKVDGIELDMVLRYSSDDINYITDLSSIKLDSQTGAKVPLSEVAEIIIEESATQIQRENQKNLITLTADTDGLSASEAQVILLDILDNYSFPDGCYYGFGGSIEMMNDAMISMGIALVVAILLVYMIMAAQFESIIAPMIVMFSMPLAITGGLLGLYITGRTLTMTSMMGFIMLVGMVVNNAIVLVDYTNQLIEDHGLDCYNALVTAGTRRIRPILMTTCTTVLGMIPLAISDAEGSETMQGMSIVVIFGLLFSTVITLILIPILYYWVHKFISMKRRRKEKRVNKKEAKIQKKLDKIELRKQKKLIKRAKRKGLPVPTFEKEDEIEEVELTEAEILKLEIKKELRDELKDEIRAEMLDEIHNEILTEVQNEVKEKIEEIEKTIEVEKVKEIEKASETKKLETKETEIKKIETKEVKAIENKENKKLENKSKAEKIEIKPAIKVIGNKISEKPEENSTISKKEERKRKKELKKKDKSEPKTGYKVPDVHLHEEESDEQKEKE